MHKSIEAIERNIDLAKLDKENILQPYRLIYFSNDIHNDDIKLIEIDECVLDKILSGEKYLFRGKDDDSAVICSQDETFMIKEAETSNMLLIFDDIIAPNIPETSINNPIGHQVMTVKQIYYEMKKGKPAVKRIQEMLEENIYEGTDLVNNNNNLYSFKDLQNCVQASDEEIKLALNNINACQIDGHWRLIDLDYKCSLIRNLLSIIDELEMPYTNIHIQQIKSSLLEHYPESIVDYIITNYLENSNNYVSLNEYSICRLNAEIILFTAEKFNLKEFLQVWQLSIPDGMQTNTDQLNGLALIDVSSKPERIIYLPLTQLSNDVDIRFQTLFNVKDKWTLQEITPYLEDICAFGQTVMNLAMKHCRVVSINGEKIISSKKPIRTQ